jgi:hypothetical protein
MAVDIDWFGSSENQNIFAKGAGQVFAKQARRANQLSRAAALGAVAAVQNIKA